MKKMGLFIISVIYLTEILYGQTLQDGTRSVAIPKETLSETLGSFDLDVDANYRYYTINDTRFFPKSDKYDLEHQSYFGYILNGSFNYKNYFKFPFYYIGSIGDEKALNKTSRGFGNGAYQSLLGLGSLIKIGQNDLYLGYRKEFFNTPITINEELNYDTKALDINKYIFIEKSESYEIGLYREFSYAIQHRYFGKVDVSKNNLTLAFEHMQKNKLYFDDTANTISAVDTKLYGIHFQENISMNTTKFLKTDLVKFDAHVGLGSLDKTIDSKYKNLFYSEFNTEIKAYLHKNWSVGLNSGGSLLDERSKTNSTVMGVFSIATVAGIYGLLSENKNPNLTYKQEVGEYSYLVPIVSYAFFKLINKVFKNDKEALESKDFIGISLNFRYKGI